MKLPNADRAIVPQAKIADYLLSQTHPKGKGKAGFFLPLGFTPAAWNVMADALRNQAQVNDVSTRTAVSDGERYTVIGPIDTPSGQRRVVRTVWQIDTDSDLPRFITAYPA